MLKTGTDNELANNLEAYSAYNMCKYVEFTCTFEVDIRLLLNYDFLQMNKNSICFLFFFYVSAGKYLSCWNFIFSKLLMERS